MNIAVYHIVVWLLLLLVLLALFAGAVLQWFAPEGYEDADGFHLGAAPPQPDNYSI